LSYASTLIDGPASKINARTLEGPRRSYSVVGQKSFSSIKVLACGAKCSHSKLYCPSAWSD
jgi:hypothetical protein